MVDMYPSTPAAAKQLYARINLIGRKDWRSTQEGRWESIRLVDTQDRKLPTTAVIRKDLGLHQGFLRNDDRKPASLTKNLLDPSEYADFMCLVDQTLLIREPCFLSKEVFQLADAALVSDEPAVRDLMKAISFVVLPAELHHRDGGRITPSLQKLLEVCGKAEDSNMRELVRQSEELLFGEVDWVPPDEDDLHAYWNDQVDRWILSATGREVHTVETEGGLYWKQLTTRPALKAAAHSIGLSGSLFVRHDHLADGGSYSSQKVVPPILTHSDLHDVYFNLKGEYSVLTDGKKNYMLASIDGTSVEYASRSDREDQRLDRVTAAQAMEDLEASLFPGMSPPRM